MKVLFQSYSFNAAQKRVTFNTTDSISLENILLITNVTNNTIIYNFANPAQGGTISNNILTLTYNTTSMSSSDKLQIFLDLYGSPATDTSLTALQDQNVFLRRIVQLLTPLATQDSAQRQRITIDAAPATITATVSQATFSNLNATVTGTVTANQGGTWNINNLALLANVDPRYQMVDWARASYNTGIRGNLIN